MSIQVAQAVDADSVAVRGIPLLLVATLAAATSIAVGAVYVSQPLLELFADSFGVPIDGTGTAFGWPMVAYAVTFLLVAPLTAALPIRWLMLPGLLVCAGGLAMASQAANFDQMVLALCIAGIAAAVVPACAFALAPRLSTGPTVGTLFGVLIAASVVGIVLGRSAGGVAAELVGWRGVYVGVAGLLMLAALALAVLRLPANARQTRIGQAYLAVIQLIRRPNIQLRLAIGGFLFFGYLGLATLLTLRLASPVFDLSAGAIGWLGFAGLIAVAGAPLAGMLVPRFGAARVAVASLVIALVAAILLTLATSTTLVAIALMLLFGGVFACQPAVLVMLSAATEEKLRGAISSVYMVICLGSGGLSSLILGGVWARYSWTGVAICALAALVIALAIAGAIALRRSR